MDCFQFGKVVHQGCILSPCIFNLHTEHSIWNARLDKSQAGISIAGRNINSLRYADDTVLMAESEELWDCWWEWKRRVKNLARNSTLKKKYMIIASDSTTSWQIQGKKIETVTDFTWGEGSKITADSDCSHGLKKHLLLRKKPMYYKPRECIKKQRCHFVDSGPYSQRYVFPVVMYRCESWTTKKAEYWRNGAGEDLCE